jgi:hypothetical protein
MVKSHELLVHIELQLTTCVHIEIHIIYTVKSRAERISHRAAGGHCLAVNLVYSPRGRSLARSNVSGDGSTEMIQLRRSRFLSGQVSTCPVPICAGRSIDRPSSILSRMISLIN